MERIDKGWIGLYNTAILIKRLEIPRSHKNRSSFCFYGFFSYSFPEWLVLLKNRGEYQ